MEHSRYTTSPNITANGLGNMANHDFEVVRRHWTKLGRDNAVWELRSRTAPIVAVFEIDNRTGELAAGYPTQAAAKGALVRLNAMIGDHIISKYR